MNKTEETKSAAEKNLSQAERIERLEKTVAELTEALKRAERRRAVWGK